MAAPHAPPGLPPAVPRPARPRGAGAVALQTVWQVERTAGCTAAAAAFTHAAASDAAPLVFKPGGTRKLRRPRRYPKFFLCMDATTFTCGTKYGVRAVARAAGSNFAGSAWSSACPPIVMVPQCDAAETPIARACCVRPRAARGPARTGRPQSAWPRCDRNKPSLSSARP
jgi:hypothetical protein